MKEYVFKSYIYKNITFNMFESEQNIYITNLNCLLDVYDDFGAFFEYLLGKKKNFYFLKITDVRMYNYILRIKKFKHVESLLVLNKYHYSNALYRSYNEIEEEIKFYNK